MQSILRTLCKILNLRGTMSRVVINNQEYQLYRFSYKSLEKCYKNSGVHIALRGHESYGATRINGRNQIHFVSGFSGDKNGCLPPWSPGCARVIIGSNRRFIAKVNLCFLFASKLLYRWKIPSHPFDDQKFILLEIPTYRSLWTQSKLFEQPTSRHFRQTNIKFSFDQVTNHATGPQRKFKFHLPRIDSYDQAINLLQLVGKKLRCLTRYFATAESFYTAFPILHNPLRNARPCEPQSFNNDLRALTSCNTLYSSDTNSFKSLAIYFPSIKFIHGRGYNICTTLCTWWHRCWGLLLLPARRNPLYLKIWN